MPLDPYTGEADGGVAVAVDPYTGESTDPNFDTQLSKQEETAFLVWKARHAPHDSGADYDLRGAFKAGLTPDPYTGHWPDTFKKPNHPTFSDQSIYAKDRPDLAGTWSGETYVPPTTKEQADPYTGELSDAGQRALRTAVTVGVLPPFVRSAVRGATSEGLLAGGEAGLRMASQISQAAQNGEYVQLQGQLQDLQTKEEQEAAQATRMLTRPSEYGGIESMVGLDRPEQIIAQRTAARQDNLAKQQAIRNRMAEIENATTLGQAANAVQTGRQAVREALPTSDEYQKSLQGQVAQGLGQAVGTLPFWAIPGIGEVVGPATSVAQIYQEGYDDAIQHGADQVTAHETAMKYLPASVLDAVGDRIVVGRILNPLVGQPIKKVIADIAARALSEGTTETGQQVWLNYVAKELAKYDPERPLTSELKDTFIVSTIVGGVASGGIQLGGEREQTAQVAEAANEAVDTAAQQVAQSQHAIQTTKAGDAVAVSAAIANPEVATLDEMEAKQQALANQAKQSQQAKAQAEQTLQQATSTLEQASHVEQAAHLQLDQLDAEVLANQSLSQPVTPTGGILAASTQIAQAPEKAQEGLAQNESTPVLPPAQPAVVGPVSLAQILPQGALTNAESTRSITEAPSPQVGLEQGTGGGVRLRNAAENGLEASTGEAINPLEVAPQVPPVARDVIAQVMSVDRLGSELAANNVQSGFYDPQTGSVFVPFSFDDGRQSATEYGRSGGSQMAAGRFAQFRYRLVPIVRDGNRYVTNPIPSLPALAPTPTLGPATPEPAAGQESAPALTPTPSLAPTLPGPAPATLESANAPARAVAANVAQPSISEAVPVRSALENDAAIEAAAARQNGLPPPATPSPTAQASEEGRTRERTVTKKLSEGRGIAAEWSKEAQDVLKDQRYDVRGMQMVRDAAQAEMNKGFETVAADFFRPSTSLPRDAQVVVGRILAKEFYARGDMANWHATVMHLAELGTSFGQGVNMFKDIGGEYTTPERAQMLMAQELNDTKRDLAKKGKVSEIAQVISEVIPEAVANNPQLASVQAIIRVLGKRKSLREAIGALLGENRTELWQRYKDSISTAVRNALKPRGENPALLQIFSRDIAKILTEKLPKPAVPQQTAQEAAQHIETILRNPEKFREGLAQAKLDLQNDQTIDPGKKQQALAVLESFVAGEDPVNTMVGRLVQQTFAELDTNPKAIAKQGTARALEIRSAIVKRISELFTPEFAKNVGARVDSILATMLNDARTQLRTAFQSQELRSAFNLGDQIAQADRLLATGTEEEIRSFLNDRLPSEQSERINELRKALQERRDALRVRVLTPADIEKRVMSRLKQRAILSPKDLQSTIGQAVDLFNAGKLSAQALEQLITEKFPLPQMTKQVAETLANHARRIASTPVNSVARRDATMDLFDYVHEQIVPIRGVDIAFALFYAHILAGYPTHVRNTLSNLASFAEIGMDVMLSNPLHWADRWNAILEGGQVGVTHGLKEGGEILRSGRRAINEEEIKFGTSQTLERVQFRGLAQLYNLSKYVSRLLRVEDVFFQALSYEIKSRQVAWELARDMATSGQIGTTTATPSGTRTITTAAQIATTVDSLLNQTPQQISDHQAQAEQEWTGLHPDLQAKTTQARWTASRVRELQSLNRRQEIVGRGSDQSARLTFNYKPEGLVGYAANLMLDGFAALRRAGQQANTGNANLDTFLRALTLAPRIEIPFIRIPANLFARAWEFGSGGASIVKAAIGKELVYAGGARAKFEQMSEDNRAMMLKRGITGLATLAAIAAAGWPSDDPEEERKRMWRIHGKGPRDYRLGTVYYGPKWKPYSIEMTILGQKVFLPYQYLPIGSAVAMIGGLHDGKRYHEFSDQEGNLRLAKAMSNMPAALLAGTPLRNVSELLNALINPSSQSEDALRKAIGHATVGPVLQAAVPLANLWKSIESDFDPQQRDIRDIRAALISQVVGGRLLLQPRLDVLGDSVENRPGDWFFSTQANQTPEGRIFQTFAEHNLDPGDGSRWRSKLGDRYYEFYKVRQQAIKRELLAHDEKLLKQLHWANDDTGQKILGAIATGATGEAMKAVDFTPSPKEAVGAMDKATIARSVWDELKPLTPSTRQARWSELLKADEVPVDPAGQPDPEFISELNRLAVGQ